MNREYKVGDCLVENISDLYKYGIIKIKYILKTTAPTICNGTIMMLIDEFKIVNGCVIFNKDTWMSDGVLDMYYTPCDAKEYEKVEKFMKISTMTYKSAIKNIQI